MSESQQPFTHSTDSTDGTDLTGAELPATTLSREVVNIDTEWAESGRLRFRRRIVTETRTVEVTVRREELEIEELHVTDRNGALVGSAKDGPTTDAPAPAEPLVIVLQEEVPEVSLRLRPYEQVTVTTTLGTRMGRVTSEVQREEVDVKITPADPARQHPAG
jgi:uncharacterized protein (TIGR02271 family)